MAKLRFIFDKEDEEEKEKIGWAQRTRGMGELPKYEFSKVGLEKAKDIEIPISTKLKFTTDVGVDIGAKAMGGATLAKPKLFETPSSQFGISDLTKPKQISPETQQMETLSLQMKGLPTRKEQESFAYEVLTGKKIDDIFTLSLEERRKALSLMTQLQRTAVTTTEKFNEIVGTIGWVGALGIMGAQTVASLIKITPEIWRKLTIKIENKKISFKEGLEAILKTGHGEGTAYQRKIFNEAVKQADVKNISIVNMLKKGLTITEAKPRFAFGTKLYGGIPADEIVNALVKTGKLTADITKELSLAKPELVSQVIQNLSIASPAIASKLAGELVKLIPEEEVLKKVEPEMKEEIPKVEVKIPKELQSLAEEAGKYKSAKEFLDLPSKVEMAVEKTIGKLPWNFAIKHDKAIKKLNEAGFENFEDFYNKVTKVEPKVSLKIEIKPTEEKVKVEPTPEPAVPKAIPKALEPLAEEARDIITDIEGKAKTISKDEFVKYYQEKMQPIWQKDKQLYKNVHDFLISKIEKGELESAQNIWESIREIKQVDKQIYKSENITVKTSWEIMQKLGDDDKRIIRNITEFIKKEYPNKKLTISVGDQPISLAGKEGFRITTPIDAEIDIMFPYYPKIKDTLKKLEKEGISRKELWTGSDIFHELAHTLGIKDEVKADKFAIKIMKKWAKATAKPAGKVEPKVEVKAEVKPDLATPAQIKKAHTIANSKAMISEKGKVKPQYRKIAEVFTGKKSIKDMTTEEAEMFIDQLNRLPEPKYRGGKLVAPSIPRTMRLTTQDFFKKKYGEPTPIWLLTDQTYYATKLGIKPLIEPFERGKQEFDLEFRLSSNLVDRMVNKLNKIAKTSMGDRIKSKVKNIPTKAESKMAELINKHEATPSGLFPQEEDIFKYFRNLSKDIWRRENEVREKVDLPPIKYKTAYFRHTADAMAKEMLEGKYPFPQGIKYWSEKMVGKKIFNPMEFQRKLSDDLIDLWSKDIRAVTKAMLWNGLKEIYLAQPAKFLNEQLNAISKDLPEYKNLAPREKAAYDQVRVMPASTKKWLINYINQIIKGQENELDASLNRIITKSGLKGIFDKILAPFGRSIGRKPITNLFSLSGRMIISGVMGWVPRQMIRNAFQQVQNLALYGVKATIKAFLPAGIDKNLKGLLNESLFLKSYTGFEELPVNLMGKLEKIWLTPYGIVAVNNAKQGMKAAYWNILELIETSKFKKHGWADPQRTKDTPKGHLYPSEKEKLLKEMEFGASCTQYQYIPIGMPGVFRYKALIPLTRLQSWWMNYFTKFNREAIHRGLKGRPSWSDEKGPTFPWSRRVNFLKYLVIGGAILTALGYKRSFMLGVAPTYLSPAGQLALGIYNYAVADEDWKKKKALRQIYYSWKAFIPGSLAWRDFSAVWKGEKDLEEILFYGKKEKKKTQPPLKIIVPKSGELKFTEPEINIESNKLKFTF